MRFLKHATVLCAVTIAVLAMSTSASAATATGYEDFGLCPDRSVNGNIDQCFVSVVDGGHLKLGSKDTPITDPITLAIGGSEDGDILAANLDGGRQQIPGGLTGLSGLDWLSWLFPFSALAVYAEAELAGTPTNPVLDPVNLPLKVRLHNVLFTSSCYIGSDSDPVDLNLTLGTTDPPAPNQPISGQIPTPSFDPSRPDVFLISGGTLVDNAFAAPEAEGCGLLNLGLIDGLVNLQSGLPSPAGTNVAVQEFDAKISGITTIYPPNGIE